MRINKIKLASKWIKKSLAVIAVVVLLVGGFDSNASGNFKKCHNNTLGAGGDGGHPKLGGDGGGRPK
jgi:hypothetical protein